MSETAKLALPLVQAAQAQKHVTVNESLLRLDALTQLSIETKGLTTPPALPSEGEAHAVGAGAVDAWSGQDGNLAVFANGGWVFVAPQVGWRGWLVSEASVVGFDGSDWIAGLGSVTTNGAGFVHRSVETDHAVASGSTSTVSGFLPANAIVYGITGRVINAIGGAASFEIGISGSADRYGSGIGTASGSWVRGLTGTPLTYYADTDLVLTAGGGPFDGTGSVRLAVHYAELTLPRA